LDNKEFVTGLLRTFSTSFEIKTKLVFDIYDFDNDGQISKDDISAILSYMPITQTVQV
jgi:Ca2+-binding EF-hand superfamily protein